MDTQDPRLSGVTPTLSIVTTAHNEAGNVAPFLTRVVEAARRLSVEAEIIYIDDGSTDGTAHAVREFIRLHPGIDVHLIQHASRLGITAAVEESGRLARGEWLCLLPADLESLPDIDIPLLYETLDADTDLVAGVRQGRNDGKLLASRAYNLLNGWLFGVWLRDANWVKLIRTDRMRGLRLRSHWHRYLVPILVHGGCRVKEVSTPWHPRSYGTSKFGVRRLPESLADMLTVKFLLTYGRRPFLFFGWVSAGSVLLSLVCLWIAVTAGAPQAKTWTAALILSGALLTLAGVSIGLGLLGELCLGAEIRGGRRAENAS